MRIRMTLNLGLNESPNALKFTAGSEHELSDDEGRKWSSRGWCVELPPLPVASEAVAVAEPVAAVTETKPAAKPSK